MLGDDMVTAEQAEYETVSLQFLHFSNLDSVLPLNYTDHWEELDSLQEFVYTHCDSDISNIHSICLVFFF